MDALAPLAVAIPLLAAAVLAAADFVARRWFSDVVATACALAVLVLCALLLSRSTHGPVIHWFGGWRPSHGVAIGISFAVDSLGAGMATLVALMVTAALVFSARYFDAVGNLFHALLLVFLAAMVGFALTGDLFNMFVFFELMSVSAYALTAYKIEERGPLQGAINFAITNSMGAFTVLTGIALLYSRTGALNLAQLGQTLAGGRSDMLVVLALLLILTGFLIKAAIVPLHFWLADAHAVAPVPVCVLFSGVMVPLGAFGVARVYWTIFSGPLAPHLAELRAILLVLGAVTAVVGAVMCYAQRHLKRLLAFSTVSHSGVFLLGLALLSAHGLAGGGAYVLAHSLTKGALFMCVGVLIHRFGEVDEVDLHGRARAIWPVGVMFAVGGLLLASLPLSGTFFAKALIGTAADQAGYGWVSFFLVISAMLTGGAILRAAGGVFAGWGTGQPLRLGAAGEGERELQSREEQPEDTAPRDRTPLTMVLPAAVLLAGALAVGLVPGLVDGVQHAAAHFRDRGAYAAAVLRAAHPRFADTSTLPLTARDFAFGAAALAGALVLAALPLFGRSLLGRTPAWLGNGLDRAVGGLRALHSGLVSDYVTWVIVALGALGGAFSLALR